MALNVHECASIKNLEFEENFILESYRNDIKTSHFEIISSQKLNNRVSQCSNLVFQKLLKYVSVRIWYFRFTSGSWKALFYYK